MPLPSTTPGRLWIVATPLGNPGDFSPRAREIVQRADAVLCEDTRRTGLLFSQCGLTARRLVSFHDRNEQTRQEDALRRLREGAELALVSDAGTPLVADPGYRLVRACRHPRLSGAGPVRPRRGPERGRSAASALHLPGLPAP